MKILMTMGNKSIKICLCVLADMLETSVESDSSAKDRRAAVSGVDLRCAYTNEVEY